MKIGKVVGSVWSTKKVDMLSGVGLKIVATDRGTVIAADIVGAGIGDQVLLSFGSAVRAILPSCPADAAIVGILDEQEVRYVRT